MAKVTFDVSDQDAEKNSTLKTYETPPVGVYLAKISSCTAEEPENKNPRLHLVMEITKPAKNNYPPLHEYITFTDASKWKFDQFLLALGLATKTKRKGEFDDKKQVGKTLQVYITHETDTFTPQGATEPVTRTRARVANFLSKTASVNGKAPSVSDVTEDDFMSLEDHGAAADEGSEESVAHLTELAEPLGIDPEEIDTWAEVAAMITEAGEKEQDEAEEEEVEEEAGDEEPDWDEIGAAADEGDEEAQASITELCEGAGVDPDEYETWAEAAAACFEEEGEEEEEVPDYTSMSTLALKKIAKEREIPSGGTKEELIERLEEFDSTDPFSE